MPARTMAPAMPCPVLSMPKSAVDLCTVWVNRVFTNADGIDTALVRWAPGTRFNAHSHPGGEEIFVLEGVFHDETSAYPAHSWLRSPRWSRHQPYTGAEGALIYVKVGHLGARFLTP